jgi:LytS/YehU family sensor histidine kinase
MRLFARLARETARDPQIGKLAARGPLQALRSQLNPHFLFNTLHSIAELVHEDPPLAEQLILRLGELLRKVLASVDQPEVALTDEIQFIKAYLDIEQMRLGKRLTVEWDIAQEVQAARVPTLLLQPLVENAVQHGIAPRTHRAQCGSVPGAITDSCSYKCRILGRLDQSSPRVNPGIGLKNTQARLQTIFGANHQFELINDGGLRCAFGFRCPS